MKGKELRVAVRIPHCLAEQLKRQAEFDANGVSATIRRLLSTALDQERRTKTRNDVRAIGGVA